MNLVKKFFLGIGKIISYIQNHFKAMLFLLLLFILFAPSSEEKITKHNLEQINISGPILEVSEAIEQIEKATKDSFIKGVLLVVDSPGGSVSASIELKEAIRRLQEKKSVVVYAKGTLASGSYYASIHADEIMANPGSMVGSIGVIMQGANLSGLMEKIGIESQTVQAGEYKKVGTSDRAWKDHEVAELNKVIQATYDMFTQDVAQARGLELNKRDSYANAHIFTAVQAQEVGLIDSLGVAYDAKKRVEELSDVAEPIWNKEDKFDRFLKKLTASSASILHTYFPELTLR